MSYQKYALQCHASGQKYTNYGGNGGPSEEHKMPCPMCGKVVKLRALCPKTSREPARHFVIIPAHQKAFAEAPSTTAIAAARAAQGGAA